MTPAVEFDLDERLIRLAHRAYLAKRGLTVGNILTAVAPFWGIGAILLFAGGAWLYVGAGLIGTGAAAGAWTGGLARRAYRAKVASTLEMLARMGSPHFHFEFGDEGVQTKSNVSSGRHAWQLFRELYRTPEVWLLFVTKTRYVILPTTSLSGDVQRFLVRKCAECRIPVTDSAS